MTSCKKYRKKPVEVEAVLWDGNNFDEIEKMLGKGECSVYNRCLFLSNSMMPNTGEVILKYKDGTIGHMSWMVFSAQYEEVKDESKVSE